MLKLRRAADYVGLVTQATHITQKIVWVRTPAADPVSRQLAEHGRPVAAQRPFETAQGFEFAAFDIDFDDIRCDAQGPD